MKKLFSIMSNLQTHYHFKLDFQKVEQHTGGKWLIHGTKRHKDNQLQSLELPCTFIYAIYSSYNFFYMRHRPYLKLDMPVSEM